MLKAVAFVIPAFLAGLLSYYTIYLRGENRRLENQLVNVQNLRVQLQQQMTLNNQQRVMFEAQVEQLQTSLLGAQTQMLNLSEALQEAREMIDPGAAPVVEQQR